MSLNDLISAVRRSRPADDPLRIDPSELGLDAYPELGALVQFSSTASRACRESLNHLAEAAAHHRDLVIVVELPVHRSAPLHLRLGVRHTPSVYRVDARGVVTHHWARPPQREELAELLDHAAGLVPV